MKLFDRRISWMLLQIMQKLITVLRSNFDFMLFMIFLHLFIELYLLLQASRNEIPQTEISFQLHNLILLSHYSEYCL